MKKYLRIMLGAKSIHADEGFQGCFIEAGFDINQDLSKALPEFNLKLIPIWLEKNRRSQPWKMI
jgi:hypothetical protein